jgi:heme/copper-type cytochrome/quinol oxidase subunit 2
MIMIKYWNISKKLESIYSKNSKNLDDKTIYMHWSILLLVQMILIVASALIIIYQEYDVLFDFSTPYNYLENCGTWFTCLVVPALIVVVIMFDSYRRIKKAERLKKGEFNTDSCTILWQATTFLLYVASIPIMSFWFNEFTYYI